MLVLRGSLDRESLRLGVLRLPTARAAAGLAGRPPRRAAGLGHRLLPHRRRHPGGRRPTCARAATTSRRTPGRPTPPSGWPSRQRPRRRPGQGPGRDQRARAWASTPRSASSSTSARRSRRSPTTSRSAAPVAAPTEATRRAAAAAGGPRHLGLLRLARVPAASSRCATTLGVLGRGGPAAVSTATLETYVDLGRTRLEQMLKVLDVDGAVRRVRGGWEATGQRLGLRRRALRPGQRGARARAGRRCSTTSTPTGAGCGSCATSSTTRTPTRRAAAATTAAASTLSTDGLRGGGRRGPRPARAARASSIEPRKMWPTALANLGLDLKGKIGDGAEPRAGRSPA